MANPMFDINGGMGILAQPATITNPIQNPLDPQMAAALQAANAEENLKSNKAKQAYFRAQALKEQPLFAKGQGPLGVRQGVGPMGWATTLGDAIAGLIAKKRLDEATQGVTSRMGELAPAENASDAAINAVRRQMIPGGGSYPPLSF